MRLDLKDDSERKPWSAPEPKWWPGLLALGLSVVMLIYDWTADPVARQEAYDHLDEEFNQIQPPPSTREIGRYSNVKWRSVSFGSHFESYYSDDEIKSYYETLLPRLGWVKRGERPKFPRVRGLGGMRICWVKDDRVTALSFEDTDGEPTWRFRLATTWGLERCP